MERASQRRERAVRPTAAGGSWAHSADRQCFFQDIADRELLLPRSGEGSQQDRSPGGAWRLAIKRPRCRDCEPLGYLVLLLRSSANVGSGVSGGRCGLTTSLN